MPVREVGLPVTLPGLFRRLADDPTDVVALATLRAVLDGTYEVLVNAPEVRMQNLRRAKGGTLGTAGRGVVAFRFDHFLDELRTTIWPEYVSRGLCGGVGPVTRAVENPTDAYEPTTTTWAQLKAMVDQGMEVWAHSHTHGDAPTLADKIVEIETSKATLEAHGFKVQGWQMPGVTTSITDWSANFDAAADWMTEVGVLLRKNYVLTELMGTTVYRLLPTDGSTGLNHLTLDTLTLTEAKNVLDRVVRYRWGVEYMTHSNRVGSSGMSLADYQAFLDYVVTKRDAGLLEVLTPSGLAFADPQSTSRLDLIAGGDFEGLGVSDVGQWSGTTAWTWVSDGTAYTGSTFLRQAGAVASKAWQNYSWIGDGLLNGEVFEAQCRMRAPGSSAVGSLRVRDVDDINNLSQLKDVSLPAGGAWQLVRLPFAIPANLAILQMSVQWVSGGTVDVDLVRVVKV